MRMFTKIVVAIDFSPMSRHLLHYAVRLARSSPGACLQVLHVVPIPPKALAPVEREDVVLQLEEDSIARAHGHLSILIASEGLSTSFARPVVLAGQPADTIVRYARELHADLIVMDAHGHSPIVQFIVGSVAATVMHQAPCPVITLPQSILQASSGDTDDSTVTSQDVGPHGRESPGIQDGHG